MKLFSFLFGRSNKDATTIRTVTPSTIPVAKIPPIQPRVLSYAQQNGYGRGHFVGGEYDLAELGKVIDTESLVRQAYKKKEGLMFKEGLGYRGANKNTVRYIKTRMAQISRATGIPQLELKKRLARSLIRTSNAFLVKVRNVKASGGAVRKDANGRTLKPVAGYFPAAPETMSASIDANTGRVIGWRQMLPNGLYKDYPVEDVVHFHLDRREGFLFGTPELVPVLDDIRALRQIEENIELLVYQHLFPLFHYQVGTETAPAGYTEDGQREIDIVQEQVRLMPAEGAIVTPERHKIEAIGVESKALRAEQYLHHFKKRVISGLGISQVDVGDGDTTNKATAFTMSRALIDTVKEIQDTFETQWDHEVLSELLLESTFGEDVLEEDNVVHLQFHEIDIQNKIDLEKHKLAMFEGNAITWDELRSSTNMEPIPVPEDPQDQDPASYPEWHNTHWKLFGEPTQLIRAVDEPWSAGAQAAAEARTLSVTQKQTQAAQQAEQKQQQEQMRLKAKPAPQKAKDFIVEDNFIHSSFVELGKDTAQRVSSSIKNNGVVDYDYLRSMAGTWVSSVKEKTRALAVRELLRGVSDQIGRPIGDDSTLVGVGRNALDARLSFFLDNLTNKTINTIKHKVDSIGDSVRLSEREHDIREMVNVVFSSMEYRTHAIWDVELRKAYNFGRTLAMKYQGHEYMEYRAADQSSCDRCKAIHGRRIGLVGVDLEDMPPFHPHSRLRVVLVGSGNETTER